MKAKEVTAPPQAKKQVGVADYFALLGVGEELVWKHAQKKQMLGTDIDAAPEEDDAKLLERFYREIVDCTVWSADETTSEDTQYPTTLVYANATKNQPSYPVTLPSSPIPSDITSAVGTDVEPVQLEGWTIVQQTRPVPVAPIIPGDDMPPLWQRGQSWDANLDAFSGLTSDIQHLLNEQQRQREGRKKSSTPLKDLRAKVQSSFQQRLVSYSSKYKKKYYLSFRRRAPDESHRPAIANLSMYFVRLHKATLEESNFHQRSETASVRTSSVASTGGASSVSHGAAALLRVAEAGKQTFQSRVLGAPQSSNYPISAQNSMDYGEPVALASLLKLPDGYDEWSLPTIYEHLREEATLEESNFHQRSETASVRTSSVASTGGASSVSHGAAALLRVAEAGKQTFQSRVLGAPQSSNYPISAQNSMDYGEPVALASLLKLPDGYDEWSLPTIYEHLRFPNQPPLTDTPFRAVLFPQKDHNQGEGITGIEAVDGLPPDLVSPRSAARWKEDLQPKLISANQWSKEMVEEEEEYIFAPILAIRRQRYGEEERFHEDPGIVDLAVSFLDQFGNPMIPYEEVDPFEEEDEDATNALLEKTQWTTAETDVVAISRSLQPRGPAAKFRPRDAGKLCILARHNTPSGFCDAAFSTSVLDRFPYKNYKGLPLPEEELPMFCYPTGCRLHRAKFSDAPLPQYYGFVVKNERGDSIFVSCVSFFEPLSQHKRAQLITLSGKRHKVSLPHSEFWLKHEKRRHNGTILEGGEEGESTEVLTGFDEMTTFENKTICLVSRYPYWTAFRRFLSHLHTVSGSASDLPLERYISHLLLSVPIPKPGGPSVLIPLPTFNVPIMLWTPPLKDLPLVDLPYERLVSCLDIPTIVTIVLGFLALERKVIVMSTRPSLVLDVCELLRSLLFPFDLCAPYVPRLTEPFMSCLEFPGAIFVGIHDDSSPTGLAAVVRKNMPEDSTIVDLDSGSIDCSGDRMTVLNTSWGIIPPGPRSVLVSEIETLCRDAGIVPGQEPIDSLVDPAFEATMPSMPVQDLVPLSTEKKEPLDDRGIRDAFLRFFCSILGGYERFLVVPDVDFLISGNEWFDAKGFLASVSAEKATFLGSLVSTQLFQSFIQRRTEASDVHCLLFDECLAEFHSSPVPYGRLGGDVETVVSADGGQPQLLYSLLVDQSATETTTDRNFDTGSRHGSDAESSNQTKGFFGVSDGMELAFKYSNCVKNATGDWVSMPTLEGLPGHTRFIYCVDGNPTFPDRLNPNIYLPRQPESWLVEMSTAPTPMLTRSDKEIEEADRRRKVATTYRGLQTQRRCLWQLPKLMGSHVLGAWLVCIPALVSQSSLSHEQQSKYLFRAFGALRLLRNKQRIVPDEAAYRALIVACGRTKNDRRTELVKLFGLLRSDGIFPSAVTLGQYTKALAEGYSKQATMGTPEDEIIGIDALGAPENRIRTGLKDAIDPEMSLGSLDGNLNNLEESGRRWRQRSLMEKLQDTTIDDPNASMLEYKAGRTKKKASRSWLPVVFSSSFVPSRQDDFVKSESPKLTKEKIRFIALWSRTKACESCGYIPLEEEVQAGWDVLGGENDVPGAINCPRCGALLIPRLGYKELSMDEAVSNGKDPTPGPENFNGGIGLADFSHLPPQMRPYIEDIEGASYVTYVSPATLRSSLERHVEEQGEQVLDRSTLRSLDPEVFFNLWWYCARFSLPLPLPVASEENRIHYCALVGWDHQIALRGCMSAATVLTSLLEEDGPDTSSTEASAIEAFGDYPLLERFNMQGYYATVWDHQDLSEILVTLVEACDKRDFRPVVECLLRVNQQRREKYSEMGTTSSEVGSASSNMILPTQSEGDGSLTPAMPSGGLSQSVELECYRTALYLAKYQCTSAFHAFFPASLKPCKGYHFWCPIAPVPIFDRLLHEAVKRVRSKSTTIVNFQDVSEVALGFRSVFGHLV